MLGASKRRTLFVTTGAALVLAGLITGCTTSQGGGNNAPTNNTGNEETGDTITIGFSGPAADHGWLGAINSAAIAEAESGGQPKVQNASGASGLWQINGQPFPGDVFDPLTNARMAVAKYKSQGLGAWQTYTNGSYQK